MVKSVFSSVITRSQDIRQKGLGGLDEFILTGIRNADDVDGFRMDIDDAINQLQQDKNIIRSYSQDTLLVNDAFFEKILNEIEKSKTENPK